MHYSMEFYTLSKIIYRIFHICMYIYIFQVSNGFDHERVYIGRSRFLIFDQIVYVVRVYLILLDQLRFLDFGLRGFIFV